MSQARLNAACLGDLAPGVERPAYHPADQGVGIVHLGIGAFHRAHQAVYTDSAMNSGDRDWRICGVSLRSAGVRDELSPQDCLFTVTARDGVSTGSRLVGSIADVLVAPENPERVIASISAPSTRLVSLTVTEKAYCRSVDGALDGAHPDLASDLAGQAAPRTLYGYLALALARRRDAGIEGLTMLSCDNLAQNGATLNALLVEFLERRSAPLARWYQQTCACPSTMVDRIVPAPTMLDRDRIAQAIGLCDEAAIVTEPFHQWVVEDRFASGRPAWEQGGAELVADVVAYEAAKLRMLNGAHSSLAYQGLLLGHTYVHEAVADDRIRPVIERLMMTEAAPSISAAPGQDLGAYAQGLLRRFANTALEHRLGQIAMDGSQKIPQRWLETLSDRQAQGADCPAMLHSIGAWLVYIRGDRFSVSDPLSKEFARAWSEDGAALIVSSLFGTSGRFSGTWRATPSDIIAIQASIRSFDCQTCAA